MSSSDANEQHDLSHRRLAILLKPLRDPTALRELLDALDALQAFLPLHFSEEEAPDGLFDRVAQAAPWEHRILKQLQLEHESLLEAVTRLKTKVTTLDADLASFVRWCKKHEAMEGELHVDAIYTDHGGRG